MAIHNSRANLSSPSCSRRRLKRAVSLPGLFGVAAGDLSGVRSMNRVIYRVYRAGVLRKGLLLVPLVGVPLMAAMRGCSRGGDDFGSGVRMQGVAGGRETGGGKTGGRENAERAVGVGVVGCGRSSEIASRARGWVEWGCIWVNRARVGVCVAVSRENALMVTRTVSHTMDLPIHLNFLARSGNSEHFQSTITPGRPVGRYRLQAGVGRSAAAAATARTVGRIVRARVGRRNSGTCAQSTAIARSARCRSLGRHCQSLLPHFRKVERAVVSC